MRDNETLIIILFIVTNFLSAICITLLDSRNYWREKWKREFWRNSNDK